MEDKNFELEFEVENNEVEHPLTQEEIALSIVDIPQNTRYKSINDMPEQKKVRFVRYLINKLSKGEDLTIHNYTHIFKIYNLTKIQVINYVKSDEFLGYVKNENYLAENLLKNKLFNMLNLSVNSITKKVQIEMNEVGEVAGATHSQLLKTIQIVNEVANTKGVKDENKKIEKVIIDFNEKNGVDRNEKLVSPIEKFVNGGSWEALKNNTNYKGGKN